MVFGRNLIDENNVWLTSFYDFNPNNWGYLGFSQLWMRDRFMREAPNGALVVIYITKNRGPFDKRGKVVGIIQVGTHLGPAKAFMPDDIWARKEKDPDSKGKWEYAVRALRAWRIIPEDYRPVEDLMPTSYRKDKAQVIGSQGVEIEKKEALSLLELNVYEIPVYQSEAEIQSGISTFEDALKPSRAILPSQEPYWIGEADGPKHLYILRMSGDISLYLNINAQDLEGAVIAKVGFSRSPLSRCDQIQSAYPAGRFKWEILYPNKIPARPPYPNATVAVAGEAAMKAYLVENGARSLGGEFFLTTTDLIQETWNVGTGAAGSALAALD